MKIEINANNINCSQKFPKLFTIHKILICFKKYPKGMYKSTFWAENVIFRKFNRLELELTLVWKYGIDQMTKK